MERIFCKIRRVKRKLDGRRITAKVMSAVLIASSMLNAFAPVAAYAAEPELATVSLSETEHGKLAFDGTEDMTLAVEVGTDVTVNVTPDEGYFSDGITVFKGEEDGTAVDVKEGKATFTVEGDTIVTSTFYENGSVGSAAFKSVDVDEGKAVTSVEGYIRDHADVQYVGEGDELTRADVLTVTTTVIDGNKLPEGTLDALWADDDGDGMSDHWEAMLSQAVSHAVLFEVDSKADYYVGWAGADISGAKLTEWLAAENNADAKMREGFIVDEATGLVYVPKSYTEKNDEGQPIIESSRIQLVYTTSDKAAEVSFDFNSSATDVRGDVAGKGKVSFPVSAASTKVTLATDDEALENLTGRTIDSVTVNGIEYTPDFDMWEYDAETGSLEFAMPPAGIHAMSVKMSDNFGKGVANFFRMPEPRMSMNNIGTIEFKSAPWVGQTFRTSGTNWYKGSGASPGYIHPAVEGNGGWEKKTAQQAMGWQGVDLSQLAITGSSLMRNCEIPAQDTGTVKISNEIRLALLCSHAGVDPNFNGGNWNNDNDVDGDGNEWSDHYGQHFRVFQVSGGEAIVGVTVPTSHSQSGAGFFKINWRVVAGHLSVHKSSANPDITDGNDCYSLEGAEFTVYNAAGQSMGTLVTNANGDTNTLEIPEGTYTVRETKPPKGYLAAPDQQVTVHGGQTTTMQVSDNPALDPVTVVVGKFDGDKEYNANNLPQGSASLEGAEFTIEYFDTVDYDSYDALKKAGMKPTRTWVIRTNEKGYANLSEQFLVSGDDFYLDPTGTPSLPRGSVAVYESKAPDGYKLNGKVNFQKIQENPTVGVPTFNLPEIPETVIRGGVSVQKLDSETGKVPQGGAAVVSVNQPQAVYPAAAAAQGRVDGHPGLVGVFSVKIQLHDPRLHMHPLPLLSHFTPGRPGLQAAFPIEEKKRRLSRERRRLQALQVQGQVALLDPFPFPQGKGQQPCEHRRQHEGDQHQPQPIHAGDAGLADDGDEVLGAHGGDGLGVPRLDRGAERVAAVGLDDDGRLQVPARMGPGLDGRDRAGHGGVDGDAEALAVADLLADGHAVSDFDERLAGRADVLRHGDGDNARVQRDDGRLARKLLIALRMDAAEKGSFQGCTTSVHEVLGSGGRKKTRRKGSILRRPVKEVPSDFSLLSGSQNQFLQHDFAILPLRRVIKRERAP